MRGILAVLSLATLLPLCSGCLAMPNIFHPGTEPHQQARAQVFEPYPEREPGPEIVGGRPREYRDPRAEVLRVQPRLGEPLLLPYPPGQMPPPAAGPQIAYPPTVVCPPQATSLPTGAVGP